MRQLYVLIFEEGILGNESNSTFAKHKFSAKMRISII